MRTALPYLSPVEREVRDNLAAALPLSVWDMCRGITVADMALQDLASGYTGPNQRLGDYFIREFARMGTDRRQVVQFLVVGTGRIEQMPRSRFEKMVRPA